MEVTRPTPETILSLHRLRLYLPDLREPGQVRGDVTWSTEPGTPETPPRLENGPVTLQVGSGLYAGPRLAAPGETIQVVAVVSRRDCPDVDKWGEQIAVERSGPGLPVDSVALERFPTAGSDLVYYRGEFAVASVGEYRIGLGPQPQESPRSALADPVTISVHYRMVSRLLADPPLVLFDGSPPIFWNLLGKGSEDGADHELRRSLALALEPDGAVFKKAAVRLSGIFEKLDGQVGRPLDPARDPRVRIAANGGPARGGGLGDRQWAIPEGGSLSLDLIADINLPSNGQATHPRETRQWLARWVISGQDADGRPIARIYPQRFSLRVASEWEYYFSLTGLGLLASTLVALALLVGVIVMAFRTAIT